MKGALAARYQYVLSLRKAVPNFHVSVIPALINPGGTSARKGTTIRTGGTAYLEVIVDYEADPFPITISAEELPPGLHAAPCTINGSPFGEAVVLWADADAAEWTGEIRLSAGFFHERTLAAAIPAQSWEIAPSDFPLFLT